MQVYKSRPLFGIKRSATNKLNMFLWKANPVSGLERDLNLKKGRYKNIRTYLLSGLFQAKTHNVV